MCPCKCTAFDVWHKIPVKNNHFKKINSGSPYYKVWTIKIINIKINFIFRSTQDIKLNLTIWDFISVYPCAPPTKSNNFNYKLGKTDPTNKATYKIVPFQHKGTFSISMYLGKYSPFKGKSRLRLSLWCVWVSGTCFLFLTEM